VDEVVLRTMPLGFQWPTLDPFLFCVHHLDHYPAGNDAFGPAAPLTGRELGRDFAGIDGWRMYHGTTVPGFPAHPHRGFETITYVRRGVVDHADSLGAAARYGRGDVQWLTAGEGIVHAEMFPLLDRDGPNPLELFQIWLNLPREDKLEAPHFSMLWDHSIPRLSHCDAAGRATEVTVIAGPLGDLRPPAPPPASWASRPDAEVAVWHARLEPGASWELPATRHPDTVRTIYLFEGEALVVAGRPIGARTAAVVRAGGPVPLTAPAGAECLVLQGRPIGEPVVQYGPFVMTTRAEIEQAFADYRRTGFGGWPWPREDPVHGGADRGRFARHADGRVEEPAPAPARS
jgi:redox-sensitive bicupin YhaK (pirin superfamily)